MKKIFLLFVVLFWSMVFPNLSFNPFTTELTTSEVHYSDLSNKETRTKLLQNADFDFWFRHN